MIDESYWFKPYTARFRFMRVSRETGFETEVLTMLKGGTITRNSDTRINESATVNCVGSFDIGADLVRIYLVASWADGSTQDVALGTFLPSCPSRDIKGGYSTATVTMYGRLQELYASEVGEPISIPKSTNAVEYCTELIEDLGLTVYAEDSSYTTSTVRTYSTGVSTNDEDIGSTYLDLVNDLLGLANFSSAETDELGNVVLHSYVQPASRPVSWTFEEGSSAKFLRDMTEERDTFDTPNYIVVVYSDEDTTVVGTAIDQSGGEYSIDTVGRTIKKGYSYSDVPDGDEDYQQEVADTKAAYLLSTNQATVHRVTMTHMYCPVNLTDVVHIKYGTGGVEGDYAIRTQTITLSGGCPVETEVREV